MSESVLRTSERWRGAPLLGIGSVLISVIWMLAYASTAAAVSYRPPPLDRTAFPSLPKIDNTFSPLVPGTQFVYDGQADRGNGLRPHRVIFTVTGVTKMIDGVRTITVWDRDIADGVLAEEEIHFHAQDSLKNVWSLGEYPEELENGVVIGAPSTWLSGVQGAQAGINLPGAPQVGMPEYVQGIARSVGFYNVARIFATGQSICIQLACYSNVLVAEEFSPIEPGGGGVHKLYAPGVGLVRIEPAGSLEGELLNLTSVVRLNKTLRAQANARALELDKRAYSVVPDVYMKSAPAGLTFP